MSGIQITNLPSATTPLVGSEVIPIVQSACTKFVAASALGTCATTVLADLSGNWQSAYTSYSTSSADFVQVDVANTFTEDQTMPNVVAGKVTAGFNPVTTGACSSVLGGYYNQATGSGTTIGGGYNNKACGGYSNVAGGFCNIATCAYSNVAGGTNNTSNGAYSNVAGGQDNTAQRLHSNVAGGQCNTASGCWSNVGGGEGNVAGGDWSTVAGGSGNTVQATHSSAAIIGSTSITSVSGSMVHVERIFASALPTSDPGVSGVVWNDSGTLKISI